MLISGIEATAALFAFVALIYGPWQWACADLARARMFRNRDVMFDLARSGELDFDSDSYKTIRSEINNFIRFAHILTWVRILVFAKLARTSGRQQPPIYQAIKSISDRETRAKVEALVRDIEFAAVRMVFMKSPLLMVLSVITVVPVVAYFYAKQFLRETFEELGKIIQSEAVLLRS